MRKSRFTEEQMVDATFAEYEKLFARKLRCARLFRKSMNLFALQRCRCFLSTTFRLLEQEKLAVRS